MQSTRTDDVLDRASFGDHRGGQLCDESGSPGTRRPEHDSNLTDTDARSRPRRTEPAELVRAADERHVVAKRDRKSSPITGPDQCRVLVEDASLEVAQLVTGLEPELIAEHRAGALVRGQGVVLTP